jgi:hypothetical protein
MHGGRERNILRWEAHHAMLTRRLGEVNAALAATGEPGGPRERERLENLRREHDALEWQLQQLGPSPAAKMG